MNIVYFLQRRNKDIKIGTTHCYGDRCYDLTRVYGKLKLLGVMRGGFKIEQRVHKQFSKCRIGRTEFFKPTDELLTFIQDNTSMDQRLLHPRSGMFVIQRTDLIEYLREKLKDSGRHVKTINGAVTTAAIFDEALKVLERDLDEPADGGDQ